MSNSIFKNNKYFRLFIIAALVIVTDQITKRIVYNYLPLYEAVTVIPGFFNITHIHNPGGAFGFLAGQSVFWRQMVFLFVSGMAVVLIFYFYHKTPGTHLLLSIGFALILGGAIGNIIDRILLGAVIDFLDFHAGKWHWPAFNVADSAISIGIVIFAYHLLFNKMPDKM